jgi:hypothetical protein
MWSDARRAPRIPRRARLLSQTRYRRGHEHCPGYDGLIPEAGLDGCQKSLGSFALRALQDRLRRRCN